MFNWCPNSVHLAACGSTNQVVIYNRVGVEVYSFALPTNKRCEALEWDKDGEILAVRQQIASIIPLWKVSDGKSFKPLDVNLKDISFISWAKNAPYLAIATAKGNLVIYDSRTGISGSTWSKHNKKITCGEWSENNMLVLSGTDKKLTVSNEEGETKFETKLSSVAKKVSFPDAKNGGGGTDAKDLTVCVNLDDQYIGVLGTKDSELKKLKNEHGSIVNYEQCGDGYVLIGFAKGTVLSACFLYNQQETKKEIHSQVIYDFAYSPKLSKACVSGNEGIKVVDMRTDQWVEETAKQQRYGKGEFASKLGWSNDGMILTAATNTGTVSIYLYIYIFTYLPNNQPA